MSASSDETNLPEMLGYFKIINGLGNVYFEKAGLIEYVNFLKVIKCNSNSTELVHEETVDLQYNDQFASVPTKAAGWINTSASTAVFVIIFVIIIAAILYWVIVSLLSKR
jgi:hypothetical protein